LQTFGVLPEHQKKGYGMALMSAVEKKEGKFSATPNN
jgi:GNAT superfamily N-acetyltransferase